MEIQVCGASVAGAREYNDDHFCVADKVGQERPLLVEVDPESPWFQRQGLLAAVADGMGGYRGGGLASRTVLETLSQTFYDLHEQELYYRVQLSLSVALERLQITLRDENKRQAGTTLTGVALQPPDRLVLFHVGDSSVLRYRDGRLDRLTVDHTPLGVHLAVGDLTPDEALKRRDAHQLTRSLGLVGDTTADIHCLDYVAGDWYLIMTDGVSSPGRGLPRAALEQFLRTAKPPLHRLLEPMLEQAVKQHGDNATLVVLRVGYPAR